MSVKVGVRVRPFNQRESDLNCKLCVDMMGNMTRLFDAEDPEGGKHRDFTFDYSFWSHDEFEVDESGYFVPSTQKYADQKHVFEQVGLEILNNAWEGYHCCLFAYGQTGAGKSYSMVGYGANKGIVPISCQEIFTRISANTDKTRQYQVQVSMMEIYNERVQDLLIPIAKRPKEGHKIREHKTLGIYVEGMSKHYVDTYEGIEKKMEEGSRNRSIAATEMNASSSRAHTIISIEFKQIKVESGKKREKLSVIHLVDLAGSEKVGKTGATGDRLKEAAGINKSLSMLGLVIIALADKAAGKGKNHVVPYRDSCLTRILQNALGGNSKTLMICAISPATDNYEETLSTLRYADQAKRIKNNAVVNESETDKLIRTLNEQKSALQQKLQEMEEKFMKFSMMTPEEMEQMKQVKEEQQYLSGQINDRETSKDDKKMHEMQEEKSYASKVDVTQPHLSNLNEDPQLSRKVNYLLEGTESKIGRRGMEPPNTIEIGGMGIRDLHAVILKEEEGFFLVPAVKEGESSCFVNGDMISQKEPLRHLDRISFGTNNIFLLLLPDEEPREKMEEKEVTWDFAQKELYLKQEEIERHQQEEKEKKLKQEAQEALKKKEEELIELQKNLKESEEMRLNTLGQLEKDKIEIERKLREEQAAALKQQIEKKKKNMRNFEITTKKTHKQAHFFERKLLKALPKCIQLNLIAKQFHKNVTLAVKMVLSDYEVEDQEEEGELDMKKRSIQIKVTNRDSGYCYWWDPQTLSNRYYIIKDMSEQYFETGVVPQMKQEQDPFWDPPTPCLVGRCFLTTKALTYMFDNPCELPIIGQEEQCGQLGVNLVPTDQTGERNLCEEMDEEEVEFEPEEMLDKPFHFWIHIGEATIPAHYSNIYVDYAFKVSEFVKESFKSKEIEEETTTPNFEYKKLHSFPLITEKLLNYLTHSKLIFKIYGCEHVEKVSKPEPLPTPTPATDAKAASFMSSTTSTSSVPAPPQQKPVQRTNPAPTNKVPDARKVTPVLNDPRKPGKRDDQNTKVAGSRVNNKINERDLKDPKNKDCEIM